MEQALLGQILLNFDLISEDQLKRCVKIQKCSRGRALGEILIQEGHINEKTLRSILSVQRRKVEIGKAQQQISVSDLKARLHNAGLVDYLKLTRKTGASELMISSGVTACVNLHQTLVELPGAILSRVEAQEILFSLLTQEEIATYYALRSVEWCRHVEGVGRVRAHIYRHFEGIGSLFRLIPEEPWPLEQLGLPAIVKSFVNFSHGLVLVSGPSGSGKSTTLASLLHLINVQQRRHIITIEKPIETVHRSLSSLVTQVEVGRDAPSHNEALLNSMRQDPDVLMLGNLDDPEITSTALNAAETGHLVLATMPCTTAARAVLRMVDQFPVDKRASVKSVLSGALRAIVCQQLIPNIDGRSCSMAAEVMIVNPAISNLIREDRTWQIPMVMQTSRAQGMLTLDESLHQLFHSRRISLEEALARACERDRILAAGASL